MKLLNANSFSTRPIKCSEECRTKGRLVSLECGLGGDNIITVHHI